MFETQLLGFNCGNLPLYVILNICKILCEPDGYRDIHHCCIILSTHLHQLVHLSCTQT